MEILPELTSNSSAVVNNWTLKPNKPKGPSITDHMLAIYTADKPMVFKAPKTSSKVEKKDSKSKKTRAKTESSKIQIGSKSKEAKDRSSKVPTGSQSGHFKTVSNSALDINPSQPPASTLVDASMHKKNKQATRRNALVDFTVEADLGKSAPHDSIPQQQGKDEGTKNYTLDHIFAGNEPNVLADKTKSVSKGLETVLTTLEIRKEAKTIAKQFDEIKLEDLLKLVQNVPTDFMDPESPKDDPINVVDESKKEEDKDEGIHADSNVETKHTLVPKPPSPSSLPIELKELPSKFNELTKKVKGLKNHVHELEIKLPGDLKDIPPKLEEFTKTVTSAKQVETVLAKLKTLDALPSLLNKVTEALNHLLMLLYQLMMLVFLQQGEHIKKAKKDMSSKDDEEGSDSESNDRVNLTGSKVKSSRKKELQKFDFVTKDGDHIHLTEEQIKAQKKGEESTKAKAAKHEVEVRKEELVDLLGPDVVSKYYKAKLQYGNYYDKMLNRRAKSRITNYDVLTRKGPNTLKVYREDRTSEVITNFKAIDLHLGEWREIVKACSNKKGKGWSTIYEQIQTKMDYLHKTKSELGIDLDKPLGEQDSLDKLNDHTNKKNKHADDIHDYFRANKRLKSLAQYEDHPAGTVLNELVLCPGRNDHAKTFSALLLAEVDKRNLDLHKRMRPIEQLRQ
nr:hypothetical protein [Tanacetum cinerariifolium]